MTWGPESCRRSVGFSSGAVGGAGEGGTVLGLPDCCPAAGAASVPADAPAAGADGADADGVRTGLFPVVGVVRRGGLGSGPGDRDASGDVLGSSSTSSTSSRLAGACAVASPVSWLRAKAYVPAMAAEPIRVARAAVTRSGRRCFAGRCAR
ncbi:hypothetical protein AB0D29_10070 [Streptomyces sp. NPDC048424]|uniref:hypothetical protein n=1 Tax=Streptomyces sp. NPDC048424 TaxID=3155265 RepID=UPI0034268242